MLNKSKQFITLIQAWCDNKIALCECGGNLCGNDKCLDHKNERSTDCGVAGSCKDYIPCPHCSELRATRKGLCAHVKEKDGWPDGFGQYECLKCGHMLDPEYFSLTTCDPSSKKPMVSATIPNRPSVIVSATSSLVPPSVASSTS